MKHEKKQQLRNVATKRVIATAAMAGNVISHLNENEINGNLLPHAAAV